MKCELSPEERLERTGWDFFWVSKDAVVVDRPEIAYVACDRDVLYLNTVAKTRAAAGDLPRLIDEVGLGSSASGSSSSPVGIRPTHKVGSSVGVSGSRTVYQRRSPVGSTSASPAVCDASIFPRPVSRSMTSTVPSLRASFRIRSEYTLPLFGTQITRSPSSVGLVKY